MRKKFLNKATGEFTINDGFIVSKQTTLNDLEHHFGKEKLIQSAYIPNCYYTTSLFEIDNLFFKFYFTIENDVVKKIEFEIATEQKERIPWSNNRDFETSWIAWQMNDDTKFNWDDNPENEQYNIACTWGSVGVFFDFKQGTYQSYLSYKSVQ